MVAPLKGPICRLEEKGPAPAAAPAHQGNTTVATLLTLFTLSATTAKSFAIAHEMHHPSKPACRAAPKAKGSQTAAAKLKCVWKVEGTQQRTHTCTHTNDPDTGFEEARMEFPLASKRVQIATCRFCHNH
eukprot:1159472-Pelagomonas_calceolata.AAC.7